MRWNSDLCLDVGWEGNVLREYGQKQQVVPQYLFSRSLGSRILNFWLISWLSSWRLCCLVILETSYQSFAQGNVSEREQGGMTENFMCSLKISFRLWISTGDIWRRQTLDQIVQLPRCHSWDWPLLNWILKYLMNWSILNLKLFGKK